MVQLLLIIFISLFLLFILALALAIFVREKFIERWERRMEAERLKYGLLINEVFPDVRAEKDNLLHAPLTPAWLAIEEELIKRLEGPAPEKVYGCLEELGYVDYYIEMLQKGNLWRRLDAAEKLGLLRCGRSEPYLIKALGDRSKDMRNVAITSLGIIGAESSLPHLMECLKITVEHKEEASFKLVKSAIIGGFGQASLPYVVDDLGNPSWQIRAQVIDIIAEVGDAGSAGILLEALHDAEPEVRAKAAKGIGRIKEPAALGKLIELSAERDWVVRLHALRALGEIGAVGGIDAVKERLSDPNWHIRQEAAKALVRIGSEAIPALTAMVRQDKDKFAREQVLEELQRSGIIFKLFDDFKSMNDGAKKKVLELMEIICVHGVISPFLKGLKHRDPMVRWMAVDSLKKAGTEKAKEALKQAMKDGSLISTNEPGEPLEAL